jgi:hypothetical protein
MVAFPSIFFTSHIFQLIFELNISGTMVFSIWRTAEIWYSCGWKVFYHWTAYVMSYHDVIWCWILIWRCCVMWYDVMRWFFFDVVRRHVMFCVMWCDDFDDVMDVVVVMWCRDDSDVMSCDHCDATWCDHCDVMWTWGRDDSIVMWCGDCDGIVVVMWCDDCDLMCSGLMWCDLMSMVWCHVMSGR